MAWRDGIGRRTPLAVVEVPLLFETGMEAAFDATIAIVAADELRAERAGARGTAELEGREGRQLPQEEKARRATYVISNDGGARRARARSSRELLAELGDVRGGRRTAGGRSASAQT